MFPWTPSNGDDADALFCEHALIADCGKPSGPRPVADHPEGASPLGVQELIGNVSEWISDMEQDEGLVKGADWQMPGEQYAYSYVTLKPRARYPVDRKFGFRCVRGPVMDVKPRLKPSAFDE